MSSSHQFAIMSLYAGQKNYQEVCANYLWHSAISSIDSGKGSRFQYKRIGPKPGVWSEPKSAPIKAKCRQFTILTFDRWIYRR